MVLQRTLSWARLSASGRGRSNASQSSIMLSNHLFFGLPLGRLPCMCPCSNMCGYLWLSIRTAWPKYDRRRVLTTSTMSLSSASSFIMSVSRLWSLLEHPWFSSLLPSRKPGVNVYSPLSRSKSRHCTAVWTGLSCDTQGLFVSLLMSLAFQILSRFRATPAAIPRTNQQTRRTVARCLLKQMQGIKVTGYMPAQCNVRTYTI